LETRESKAHQQKAHKGIRKDSGLYDLNNFI
jgi:hypothetical protein